MIYQEYEMTEIDCGDGKRKVCPECKTHKQIIHMYDIPDDVECREIDCKNTYIISDRNGKYITEGQCQCYSLSHIDKKSNKNEKYIKKLLEEKNARQLALHTIALMESLDKIRQRIQEIEVEQ